MRFLGRLASIHGGLGSGVAYFGGAVASDTRDPRFESTHGPVYLLATVLKTE